MLKHNAQKEKENIIINKWNKIQGQMTKKFNKNTNT